jgi:hypothetical protein
VSEKQLDYETGEIKVADVHQQWAPLFAKLARVMGKIERLPKTGWNDFQKYKYASDADVSDLIRPLLAAEGVCLFVDMLSAEERDNKTWCHFSYTFADGETGETWTCTWWAQALSGKDDKGINKAATAGLKYFLLKNFIIGTGDLADEPDASGPAPEAKKQQEPKPKAEVKATAAEFYATILRAYPYYNHINHVKNTLKQLGYTGFKASEVEKMTQDLSAHAAEKESEDDNHS